MALRRLGFGVWTFVAMLVGMVITFSALTAYGQEATIGPPPDPGDPLAAFLLRSAATCALIAGCVGAARRSDFFGADTDAAKVRALALGILVGVVLGLAGLAPSAPSLEQAHPVAAMVVGGIVAALATSAGVTGLRRTGRVTKKRKVPPAAVLAFLLFLPLAASAADYGALTLAAATATVVTSPESQDRVGVYVRNGDAASIWCGSDSSITNSNALEVEAGDTLWVQAPKQSTGRWNVYCYSVAGTAAGAVRYWWVRL